MSGLIKVDVIIVGVVRLGVWVVKVKRLNKSATGPWVFIVEGIVKGEVVEAVGVKEEVVEVVEVKGEVVEEVGVKGEVVEVVGVKGEVVEAVGVKGFAAGEVVVDDGMAELLVLEPLLEQKNTSRFVTPAPVEHELSVDLLSPLSAINFN